MTSQQAAAAADAGATVTPIKHIKHGEHIDTIETVDTVFKEQRRLSFGYGAVFFAVTLAIPAMSVLFPAWYANPVWGGFTLNYLFVSLLYFIFLWAMAWTYAKAADKLDDKLNRLADEEEARVRAQGGV